MLRHRAPSGTLTAPIDAASCRAGGRSAYAPRAERTGSGKEQVLLCWGFPSRSMVIPKMQPLHRGGWGGSVSGDRGQVPLVLAGVPGLGSWVSDAGSSRPEVGSGDAATVPLLSMRFSGFAATQMGTGNSAGGTRRGRSAQPAPFGMHGAELSGLMLTHSSASAAPNYS